MGAELIQIRRARPEDAAGVAVTHEAAWRLAYQGLIPHPYLDRMIARRGPGWWRRAAARPGLLTLAFDGAPQGYASYGPARLANRPGAGEIFELYLAPSFQGVGLGKRLFFAARAELRKAGLGALAVWALEENSNACGFYERMGGRPSLEGCERYGATELRKLCFLWPPGV